MSKNILKMRLSHTGSKKMNKLLIIGMIGLTLTFVLSCYSSNNPNAEIGSYEVLGDTIILPDSFPQKDRLIPDSAIATLDSIALDSNRIVQVLDSLTTTDSSEQQIVPTPAIPKYNHIQTFFENTPYSTRVKIYEGSLDSLEIVLIDNQYQNFSTAQRHYPYDYLMLTNGGMFHPQGIPVGLFIEDCNVVETLNQQKNKRGNFFLLPNGVFYVTNAGEVGVLETKTFAKQLYNKETEFKLATQSGPMLLIDGKIHPKFNQTSPNRYIRSGVGVTPEQKIIFIISEQVVNFHTFASIFLELGCKNALYLDGAISQMYIKENQDQLNHYQNSFGPVIGLFKRDSLPSTDSLSQSTPSNN